MTGRWAGAAVVAASMALGAAAPAQVAGGAHVTRTVQAFTQLEESLLQALRTRDAARVEPLVDDDFEMIVAQDPGSPVVREDWLAGVRQAGAGDWALEPLSVREFGDLAVTSFVLRPAPTRPNTPALFVVDTWRRQGGAWRLAVRHVAPAVGPRRGIPGDTSPQVLRKKF